MSFLVAEQKSEIVCWWKNGESVDGRGWGGGMREEKLDTADNLKLSHGLLFSCFIYTSSYLVEISFHLK